MDTQVCRRFIAGVLLTVMSVFLPLPVWALDPALLVSGIVAAGSLPAWNLGYQFTEWWSYVPTNTSEEELPIIDSLPPTNGEQPLTPNEPPEHKPFQTGLTSPETADKPAESRGPDLLVSVTNELQSISQFSAAQIASLNSTRYLNLSAAQSAFTQHSDVRQILDFYRTGQLFLAGAVSVDDFSLQTSLASLDGGGSGLNQTVRYDRRWHSFVRAYGSRSSYTELPDINGMSSSVSGLNVGVFSQASQNTLLGLMFGVRKTANSFSNKLGSGSLETIHFGPFVSWQNAGWQLDGALSLGLTHYTSSHKDAATEAVKGSRRGFEWSAYGALGYEIDLDGWLAGLSATPTLEVMYMHSEAGSYKEKGSLTENLNIAKQAHKQLIMRAATDFNLLRLESDKPAVLRLSLGWQQQYLKAGKVRFTQENSSVENHYHGPAVSDSGLYVGLGYQQRVAEDTTIALQYTAIRSSKSQSDGLQFSLERKF